MKTERRAGKEAGKRRGRQTERRAGRQVDGKAGAPPPEGRCCFFDTLVLATVLGV